MDTKVTKIISQIHGDTEYCDLTIEQKYSIVNYLRKEIDEEKNKRSDARAKEFRESLASQGLYDTSLFQYFS